ncbi:response regulator transcription factor [Halarcobacter bivalviorum]|uniref:Two-component system response regulator n=1 Tax=Halarcobacter bivalviorum TaxID=663364 RepID=A0AAX2AA20_9BACT|nr:response regulator [Halarcobacter bivalviorum]AXH12034.1 two-component system response regulator [Halarcobacter bivalviorum]RXK11147.1 hypothetical protein CRV05_01915 [Halarcobacter bivalviorum]
MARVLYVEDDLDVSEIMKDMLGMFFDEVYVAYDGVEGLDKYKEYNPDLVISDILMPRMDGLELVKEIYSINKDAKIILTTADNELNYQSKAKELGVFGYLNKPIDFSELQKFFDKL